MQLRLKLKGITLMETLVYLALFGVIFTAMVQFSISVAQSTHSAELRQHIERAKVFVLQHVDDSFGKANSIDLLNTVLDNDNGKVRLLNSGGFYEYSLSSGTLHFNHNDTISDLTNSKVNVDRFYLQAVEVKTDTVGIRMTLQLSSKTGNETETIESLFIVK